MSKWIISKSFEGAYSHRVWSQKLSEEHSLIKTRPCTFCHGHNYIIRLYMESYTLQNNMVSDFHNMQWMKQFLDNYIDHRFIIDASDPLFGNFISDDIKLKPVYISGVLEPVGSVVDLDAGINWIPFTDLQCEWYGSYFIIPFVPTSENLSRWIFLFASEKMKSLGKVSRVDWYETPKSCASFIGE